MLRMRTWRKLIIPMIDTHPYYELPAYYIIDGLLVYAHGGIDIKMLSAAWTPKYYSDSAGRRRFMCKSIMVIRKENPPAWEWKIPMTSCRGLQIFCRM